MKFEGLAVVVALLLCHTVKSKQNDNENIDILLKDKKIKKVSHLMLTFNK